jgi:hypothetical protein
MGKHTHNFGTRSEAERDAWLDKRAAFRRNYRSSQGQADDS